MRMMMTRCVNSKMRYYSIELMRNLFDEWLLIRSYGSMKCKAPTGVMQMIFTNKEEAEGLIDVILLAKEKKGYRLKVQKLI